MGKYLAAMTLFTLALAITIFQPMVLNAMGGSVPIEKVVGGYIGFWLYGFAFTAIGMLISAMTENQLVAAIGSIGVFMIIFLLDGLAAMLPATQIFAMAVVIVAVLVVAFLIYRAIKDIYVTGIIAVLGVGAAVLLYFFVPSVYDNLLINVADWSSLVIRYTDFYTGVFDFSNVVFYVTFTVFMVFLTVQVIEKRRWN
jgi:ABC-2 type transport system permease protein